MEKPYDAGLYRESQRRQAEYLLTQISFEIAELDERIGDVRATLGRCVGQERVDGIRRAQGLLRDRVLERRRLVDMATRLRQFAST